MLLSMKHDSFCPSFLEFFHRVKFSSVIDSLLNDTTNTNSIIHWIKIRAVCGPHVRRDEIDILFCIMGQLLGHVRWSVILLKCPFVMMAFCSDLRQQALF